METIKVNMNPNPLDVQTIHASQNDGEARQWGFELHNNGDVIGSSEVTDQITFKAYEGGTEQILPTNGSTPTTSPFKGDIKYPQGLLSDQEFLYRESPTEKDGLAKITDIKGNTIVWNQLVPISTRATTTTSGITFTNNNDGSVKASGTASALAIFNYANANAINIKSGHKYLLKGCPSGGGGSTYQVSLRASNGITQIGNDVGNGILFTASSDYTNCALYLRVVSGATINGTYTPQLFDLTQMGLDITASDFTSLFPLSYYSYNQGSLLSFNGTAIKTTTKNLVYKILEKVNISPSGELITDGQELYDTAIAQVVAGNKYIITPHAPIQIMGYFTTDPVVGSRTYNNSRITDGADIFTAEITGYVAFRLERTKYDYVQLELGVTRTSYEEYVSNTTDLPISQYFPTGMKSAGTVYDELTPSKAITRIGELNIDSSTTIATWESNDGWTANLILNTYKPNGAVKSDKFEFIGFFVGASAFATSAKAKGGYCLGALRNENRIYFYSSSATTSNDLINAIRGTNLYYELLTPTETSFTTASLVTENAEIPLSNEDGILIGKCTEELSENPGFIDAKIKLSDSDGECYSNKIQLHVERSPQ